MNALNQPELSLVFGGDAQLILASSWGLSGAATGAATGCAVGLVLGPVASIVGCAVGAAVGAAGMGLSYGVTGYFVAGLAE